MRKIGIILSFAVMGLMLLYDNGFSADTTHTTRWTVKNKQLFINGAAEPFIAKGICYSPVPLGSWGGTENGDLFYKDWRTIYFRDISILRDMGVNTIRTYYWWAYKPEDNVINLADCFVIYEIVSRRHFLSLKFSARPDGFNRLDEKFA